MKNGEKASADGKRPKPYNIPKHYSKALLIKAIQSKRSDTLIKDGAIDNKRAMAMAAPGICPSGSGFGFGLRPTSAYEGAKQLLGGVRPPNPSGGR